MARYLLSAGAGLAVGYCMPKIPQLSSISEPLESALAGVPWPKPSVRVTYFDLTGRAEMIRLVLAQGGVPFQDERVDFADWGKLKLGARGGQLPNLTVDGKTFGQSLAILRMVGKLSGLYPSDPIKALAVDEVIGISEDVAAPLYGLRAIGPLCDGLSDREKQKRQNALGKHISEKSLPEELAKYERLLEQNPSGWFVGSEPTIADFAVSEQLRFFATGYFERFGIFVDLSPFPKLRALCEKVHALPKVADWDKSHASTPQKPSS